MGLKITTDQYPVTVVRQDKTSSHGNPYTQYSVMVSSKNGDTWVNDFLDCAFKKGTNIDNKTKIHINNAFFMVSEYNGKKQKKLFISDYTIDGQAQQSSGDGFMNLPSGIDEELPFQ